MFFLSVFFTSPQVLQAQSRCSSLEISKRVPHLSLGSAGAEQMQFFVAFCVPQLSPGAAGVEQVQFFGAF